MASSNQIVMECKEQQEHRNEMFVKMREEGKLCDFLLCSGCENSQNIAAHKVVLAASSAFFNRMFDKESSSLKTQFNKSVLESVIEFMYTGKLIISPETIMDLLKIGNLFELAFVQQSCRDQLLKTLNPMNCIGLTRFAESISDTDLSNHCFSYTKDHFGKVMETSNELLSIDESQLTSFIESNEIVADEMSVIQGVCRWIEHVPVERMKVNERLFSHVRFMNLTKGNLTELTNPRGFARKYPSCQMNLVHASNYHFMPPDEQQAYKAKHPEEFIRRKSIYNKMLVADVEDSYSLRIQIYDFEKKNLEQPIVVEKKTPFYGTSNRCIILKDKVYVIGVRNDDRTSNSTDIYDLTGKCWSDGPRMNRERYYFSVLTLDGLIYVIGGEGQGNDDYLDSCEVLDPKVGEWKSIAPMSSRRSYVGAIVARNKIYVFGGYNPYETSGPTLNITEKYNPVTNLWTQLPNMPTKRYNTVVGSLNNSIYVAGGYNHGGVKKVECFDLATSTWHSVADLNSPRCKAAMAEHEGNLYIFGGDSTRMEKYDPETDSWQQLQHEMKNNALYPSISFLQ